MTATTWAVMLIATVGTLLVRVPVTALTDDWTPGPRLANRLAALAPASAAALLVASLFGTGDSFALPAPAEVAAVAAAVVAMRRTSILALGLAAGIAVVLVLP